MDRSTTPRVSQLPQSRRRKASRSRSGSEELKQILGAASSGSRPAEGSADDHSNDDDGGGSSDRGGTPNLQQQQQQQQASLSPPVSPGRAVSPPGLFGWVRNALQLGPSSTSGGSGSGNNSPLRTGSGIADPIVRNTTPLLPGILPSFHHRGISDRGIREEEDENDNDNEGGDESGAGAGLVAGGPRSTRSSVSFDAGSSVGHHSLEAFRRGSSYSTISTSTSTTNLSDEDDNGEEDDEEEEGGNDSEEEGIYAPFSARSDAFAPKTTTSAAAAAMAGPALVRPTARREGISLGVEEGDDDGFEDEFGKACETEHEAFSRSLRGGRAEVSLSIQEARDPHHQVVQDTTPASKAPPSVVLTPPDSFSAPMSPIAGWVEASASSPERGEKDDDDELNKLREVAQLHASSKTPVPSDFQKSTDSSSTAAGHSSSSSADDDMSRAQFFSFEAQRPQPSSPRRPSAAQRPTSSAGDGEQIDDFIGRPQSPEDVKRARPSRETVAIGSRQAGLRSKRQSERSAKATVADTRQEWDDSSRTKTPTAASALVDAGTANDVSLSTPRIVSASADGQEGGAQQRSALESKSGGEAGASSSLSSSTSAPAPAVDSALTAATASPSLLASPQPRRAALNFFGRRREASQSSVREDMTDDSTDMASPQSTRVRKDSNLGSSYGAGGSFWRLGAKKSAKDDKIGFASPSRKQARPSSSAGVFAANTSDVEPSAPAPELATSLLDSESMEKKEKSPSTTSSLSRKTAATSQVGKMETKDASSTKSKACKVKTRRPGALTPDMQPIMIKVRAKNKSSKDRNFSRLFLAQELPLGGSSGAEVTPTSTSRPTSSSSLPSVAPPSPNPSAASNGDAKLPNAESMGSVSSATSSNLSSAQSSSSINTNNNKRKKATWAMKFSLDGRHLAVAGQDAVIRVYAVLDSPQARAKVSDEEDEAAGTAELTPPRSNFDRRGSSTSIGSNASSTGLCAPPREGTNGSKGNHPKLGSRRGSNSSTARLPNLAVFSSQPVREFRGHSNDILDLSWSKGGFLLSASMDKTARLWHLSWPNSLVSFVHGDFVTSACFHPKDDRFFLSGSLDGKLRLWNIAAKKVQKSQEVPGLITATSFTRSGKTACVGTFAGAALFYNTDELQYTSSIAVKSPSGTYAKGGRKITAIEPLCGGLAHPSYATASSGADPTADREEDSRVVITSNDSRVRAYDVTQKKLLARWKAKTYVNRTSQIRANVSADVAEGEAGAAEGLLLPGSFIVAGSEATSSAEGGQVHIWDAGATAATSSSTSNGKRKKKDATSNVSSEGIPSDEAVEYFTAHAGTVTCAVLAPLNTLDVLAQSDDFIESKTAEKSSSSASLSSTSSTSLLAPANTDADAAATAATATERKVSRNPKWNRIIVSVDESAIVRVWRADSLGSVPNP